MALRLAPLLPCWWGSIDSAFLFWNTYSMFIDFHTILLHVFLPCLLTLLLLSVHMPRHRGLRPESCFAIALFSLKADVQCCISIAGGIFHTFSLFLLLGKELLLDAFWTVLVQQLFFYIWICHAVWTCTFWDHDLKFVYFSSMLPMRSPFQTVIPLAFLLVPIPSVTEFSGVRLAFQSKALNFVNSLISFIMIQRMV